MANPEIVRYIRENRETYTREAIDRNLADAGYSEPDIQAAWQDAVPEDAPASQALDRWGEPLHQTPQTQQRERKRGERVFTTPVYWASFLGFVVGIVAVTALLGYFVPEAAAIVFLLALLGGFITSVLLLRKNQPVAFGLASALVVVFLLPFLAIVIFAGICIAQLSA